MHLLSRPVAPGVFDQPPAIIPTDPAELGRLIDNTPAADLGALYAHLVQQLGCHVQAERLWTEAGPFMLECRNDRPTSLTDKQIADLRERTRRETTSFADPKIVHKPGPTFHSREWAEAIIGGQLTAMTWPVMYLLHIAMEAEPEPPITRRQAAEIAERERQAAASQETRDRRGDQVAQRRASEANAYAAALRTCLVKVAVRENPHGRIRSGVRESVRHAVPDMDAVSGRNRQHRADRALCEDIGRTKPLNLNDEATDEPVTCVRCLMHVATLRPVGTTPLAPAKTGPKRPTRAQRDLMDHIGDGRAVRDRYYMTERLEALSVKGWAVKVDGNRWELTDCGRAALEA
ncbi:hypothetical protein OIE69_43980 (plasmid) [Actinacidiphila glaucinigra]|uniref:hypothetical protein n=1 Tax=Actinacidiphila glaucinigra TaxID=235986 RepID=UPI002DD79E89|nr:hypothetical protein [Actinacidiphila glaucinigra]WSD65865.1 hypothetical protein OIE69_43980 [Actinacidiphila glaucinigra]